MKSLFLFVATAAVFAGGATAHAQHGHGGYGHGGYAHGGYGHGGYGHGGYAHGLGHVYDSHLHGHLHGLTLGGFYGSYGVGYPYTYGSSLSYPTYSYPPVVAAPVVTAPPAAVVPAAGVTTSTSLKPNAIPPYAGPGVTLRLPAEYPGSVYVQVDKREVEIKPGTEVVLKDKYSYRVEFDRGGEFGTSSDDITEGVYKFKAADKGWFLVPDDVATGGVRRNALPGEPKK